MNCSKCGEKVLEEDRFCSFCGNVVGSVSIGYSTKIHDPAFSKYIKNTYRWSAIFSVILAIVAVTGFYISGEVGSEMDNPESMYIGFGIGGMFLLIALFQIIGKKQGKTWDGVVVDKRMAGKRRKVNSGNNATYWQDYRVYTVFIKSETGKKYEIATENDTTVYDYYAIGDKVRHHKGLNTYEKFDKSKDSIAFCNACASLNDISNEVCFRCKCPLLK